MCDTLSSMKQRCGTWHGVPAFRQRFRRLQLRTGEKEAEVYQVSCGYLLYIAFSPVTGQRRKWVKTNDIVTKEFEAYPDVAADILNALLHRGKRLSGKEIFYLHRQKLFTGEVWGTETSWRIWQSMSL